MQLTQKDPDTNVQLAQIGKNAQKNIDRKSGGNMCTRKLIEFTKTSEEIKLKGAYETRNEQR